MKEWTEQEKKYAVESIKEGFEYQNETHTIDLNLLQYKIFESKMEYLEREAGEQGELMKKENEEIMNAVSKTGHLPRFSERLALLGLVLQYIGTQINKLEMESKKSVSINDIEKPTELENLFSDISWENKTEMIELIYVLYKSKRIRKNDKPILEQDLIKVFEKVFNTDLTNFHDLLKKAKASNKRLIDGNYFMKELADLIKSDIETQK